MKTPAEIAQRLEQAREWRWWRKQSPAGARRSWLLLRNWIRGMRGQPPRRRGRSI